MWVSEQNSDGLDALLLEALKNVEAGLNSSCVQQLLRRKFALNDAVYEACVAMPLVRPDVAHTFASQPLQASRLSLSLACEADCQMSLRAIVSLDTGPVMFRVASRSIIGSVSGLAASILAI